MKWHIVRETMVTPAHIQVEAPRPMIGTTVVNLSEQDIKEMWNALQDQLPLCQFCLDRLPREPSCDKLDCDRRTRRLL